MDKISSAILIPRRFLTRLARDRRGTVAVILALALFAIVGFAGLGTEVASWYYTKRAMQGAADSAASSAAAELAAATSAGSTASSTQIANTGRSVSGTFHFTNGISNTTVSVNNPPATTTSLLANDTGGAPADITVNGNFNLNITAPTTGPTAGIALFQDRVSCPGCGNKLNGGSSSNITGAIYFPTNAVSYSGGSATGGAVCTQLIAYTITFKGNSTFNSNCSSAGTKQLNTTNGTLVM
jgi:Flp pilus assembly protein TadG